uniref:Uncharacterized protein n=1 Tax=Acrobeloides nanus TaxID=290746 RepID=A0A914DC15_9BILA
MAVRFIPYTNSIENASEYFFSVNDAIQYVDDIGEKSMVGNPNQTLNMVQFEKLLHTENKMTANTLLHFTPTRSLYSNDNFLYEDIKAAGAIILSLANGSLVNVTTLVGLDLNLTEICKFESTTNKTCSSDLGDLILFVGNNTESIVQGILNHTSMFRTI